MDKAKKQYIDNYMMKSPCLICEGEWRKRTIKEDSIIIESCQLYCDEYKRWINDYMFNDNMNKRGK